MIQYLNTKQTYIKMNLDYKNLIDEYITTNNKNIEEWAVNSIKSKSQSVRIYSGALLSELYMYIYENQQKVYNKYLKQSNDIMKGFIIYFFIVQISFHNTTLNAKMIIKEVEDYNKHQTLFFYDKYEDEDSEAERIYNIQQRINQLNQKLGTLTLPESIFYNLYYVQNKSIRQISKEIGTSTTSIWRIKNEIDKKIKDGTDNL